MVANNYPIIKYPQAITDKLIAQEFITMLRSDTTPVQLPLPNIYHRHFSQVLIAAWVLILSGIFLKLVTGGMLVVAVVATIVGISQYLSAESRLAERRKKHQTHSTPAIDWQLEAKKLVQSNQKSTAYVGKSESFFLERLRQHFGNSVNFGCAYLPDGFPKPYSSDIELILSNGLGIQIEIDEPYYYDREKQKNLPHHWYGKDNDRDDYFLQLGWIVIRFSEWQAVTDPQGCCGVIAAEVLKLTQDRSWSSMAAKGKTLCLDPHWSWQDAQKMADRHARLSYLKQAGLWVEAPKEKPRKKQRI
jgi:hypothetical protein